MPCIPTGGSASGTVRARDTGRSKVCAIHSAAISLEAFSGCSSSLAAAGSRLKMHSSPCERSCREAASEASAASRAMPCRRMEASCTDSTCMPAVACACTCCSCSPSWCANTCRKSASSLPKDASPSPCEKARGSSGASGALANVRLPAHCSTPTTRRIESCTGTTSRLVASRPPKRTESSSTCALKCGWICASSVHTVCPVLATWPRMPLTSAYASRSCGVSLPATCALCRSSAAGMREKSTGVPTANGTACESCESTRRTRYRLSSEAPSEGAIACATSKHPS
mmetsp:Transcript_14528/g.36780  ORF Transcript_14528/g.36780 Transcript_14528/m.36780 type:complete len:285 (-) Transcript_14528:1779-2633(-)